MGQRPSNQDGKIKPERLAQPVWNQALYKPFRLGSVCVFVTQGGSRFARLPWATMFQPFGLVWSNVQTPDARRKVVGVFGKDQTS